MITLNEVASKKPVDLERMSVCFTNITKSHRIYAKMSTQIDSTDYLYQALQSNNEHNQALIGVLDQLITARNTEQSVAPKTQLPAPGVQSKNYDKQYGAAYDFMAMTIHKRGEHAPPPTIKPAPQNQPRPQNTVQVSSISEHIYRQ